jgi:hypothetical protein
MKEDYISSERVEDIVGEIMKSSTRFIIALSFSKSEETGEVSLKVSRNLAFDSDDKIPPQEYMEHIGGQVAIALANFIQDLTDKSEGDNGKG